MSRIKLSLIVLFIWFALILNFDRLVGAETALVDPMVPILVVVMSVILFGVPFLARQSILASIVAVFIAYSGIFAIQNSLLGLEFSMFLVGITILTTTLILVRYVAKAIHSFDKTAESFLMGADHQNLPVLTLTEGEEEINHELYRARRFDRSVAIIYCEIPDTANTADQKVEFGSIQWEISKSLRQRYNKSQLIRSIISLTYKSDIIVDEGKGIVVCLPETNSQEAQVFIQQLNTLIQSSMNISPALGAACFPDEGLVFDKLVEVAKANSQPLDTDIDGSVHRKGDVMVDPAKRLQIEEASAWLNSMTSQGIQERKAYDTFKRAVDIVFVLLLFPLILPTLVIVGLAIYLDDKGPIFYMQPRTGYGGKRFKMYKFRTMYVGAKSVPPQKVVAADGSIRYLWPEKVEHDDRITRVGKFLRKTSLDELPQLLNVLNGDMSLIGPRPTTWDLDKYTRHQTTRLTVRPGITGLWQVSARDAVNADERLIWDMKYIEKMSFWLDVRIVWMTVAQVFKKGGV